jgi:putative membrane protein
MKKQAKTIFLQATGIILSAALLTACNETEKNTNEDPKDVAEEHNDAKFSKIKEKEAQFLVDAADISMQQVKLAELAQTQASAEDVKELAKFLKEDHSKCLKELEDVAKKKQVTLPLELSKDGQNAMDRLSDKANTNFDKDYTSRMVDMHEEAIKKYEKVSNDGEDYELKTWATKKLEELRRNLDRSMICRDKYKDADKDKDKNIIPQKNTKK